jgi:Lhr-like helicase
VCACTESAPEIPETWRLVAVHQLSPLQERALAARATGADVLALMPTGSGKTLVGVVPAAARWISTANLYAKAGPFAADMPLPPVAVWVVPWRALAFDLEREMNEHFADLVERGIAAGG